jgi:hypothetical protein
MIRFSALLCAWVLAAIVPLSAQVQTPSAGFVFDVPRHELLRIAGEPGAMRFAAALPDGWVLTSGAVTADGRSAVVRAESPQPGLYRVAESGVSRLTAIAADFEVLATGEMTVVRDAHGLTLLDRSGAVRATVAETEGGEAFRSVAAPLNGACVYLLGMHLERFCAGGQRTRLASAGPQAAITVDSSGLLTLVSPAEAVIERYREGSLISRQAMDVIPASILSLASSGGRLAIQTEDSRRVWILDQAAAGQWVELPFAIDRLVSLPAGSFLAAPAVAEAPYLTMTADRSFRPFFVPVN